MISNKNDASALRQWVVSVNKGSGTQYEPTLYYKVVEKVDWFLMYPWPKYFIAKDLYDMKYQKQGGKI